MPLVRHERCPRGRGRLLHTCALCQRPIRRLLEQSPSAGKRLQLQLHVQLLSVSASTAASEGTPRLRPPTRSGSERPAPIRRLRSHPRCHLKRCHCRHRDLGGEVSLGPPPMAPRTRFCGQSTQVRNWACTVVSRVILALESFCSISIGRRAARRASILLRERS